jgi:sugar phosphate isomerase/epimerase
MKSCKKEPQTMKVTTNITNTICDLERFSDENDIRAFCKSFALDGFELLPYGENTLGVVPAELLVGIHLSFDNCWVDFWHGDEAGVFSEYDDWETAKNVLGENRQAMIDRYKAQLDFAERMHAAYVVFHVTDISTTETLTYHFDHSDAHVVDTCLELINILLADSDYSFYFLVENLWWAGFNMKDPEMTAHLMAGIQYEKKGIMLDTGHLMHTNLALASQEEGLQYIHAVLDAHGELCHYIKGLHLQQSLTGDYVKALIENPPVITGTYHERMMNVYPYVFKMDEHEPFTVNGVDALINRIDPLFLTYEFITTSRDEHEDYLRRQIAALAK